MRLSRKTSAAAADDDFVVATKTVTATGTMDVNVSCPDGTRAISGFNSVFLSKVSGSKGEFHQYASYPVTDSKTWKFIFKIDNGSSNWGGTLGVMCAKVV
ncbi:hypothetical protein [Streptomyces sp. NPDC047999]|uniref:hypothetical protein n=1 Tax=Streptomyces sp. NPDC047999 TaxID=3365497 RepID=UPI003716D0A9